MKPSTSTNGRSAPTPGERDGLSEAGAAFAHFAAAADPARQKTADDLRAREKAQTAKEASGPKPGPRRTTLFPPFAEPKPKSADAYERRDAFERVYAAWLAARAAFHDPDKSEDEDATIAHLVARDAAEHALLATPAPDDCCLWMKWEVLDTLVIDEATSGPFHDRRVISALGSIKADVARLLGERE